MIFLLMVAFDVIASLCPPKKVYGEALEFTLTGEHTLCGSQV